MNEQLKLMLENKPTMIDELDEWLENYLACIHEARDEALRVELLRDAAPDMLAALQSFINGKPEALNLARAAVNKALIPRKD